MKYEERFNKNKSIKCVWVWEKARIRVRDAYFVTPFYGPCIISMIRHHNKDSEVQRTQKRQRPCNPAPLSQHTNTTWNCIMSFIWVRHVHCPHVTLTIIIKSTTRANTNNGMPIFYTNIHYHHHHVGHITCSLPKLRTAKPQSPIWIIHATAACQAVERTLISISRAPDWEIDIIPGLANP